MNLNKLFLGNIIAQKFKKPLGLNIIIK